MTAKGAALLHEELTRLKSEERPRITVAIAEARAHGDLRENAEYHAAREQQSFVEGRIRELEHKLSRARVIDPQKLGNPGHVVFGMTVELLNLADDSEMRIQIVGEDEADMKTQKISIQAPLARGLIGKEEGEVVEITVQGQVIEYEITAILVGE